jgi:hypothetical protein
VFRRVRAANEPGPAIEFILSAGPAKSNSGVARRDPHDPSGPTWQRYQVQGKNPPSRTCESAKDRRSADLPSPQWIAGIAVRVSSVVRTTFASPFKV